MTQTLSSSARAFKKVVEVLSGIFFNLNQIEVFCVIKSWLCLIILCLKGKFYHFLLPKNFNLKIKVMTIYRLRTEYITMRNGILRRRILICKRKKKIVCLCTAKNEYLCEKAKNISYSLLQIKPFWAQINLNVVFYIHVLILATCCIFLWCCMWWINTLCWWRWWGRRGTRGVRVEEWRIDANYIG